MTKRPFWIDKINHAWQKRPIVWLSGVRRVGKTTLAKMFENTVFLNCDLPSTIRQISDPELFYHSLEPNSTIIFDEVHRVADPSRLLKIAADEFSHFRILATGSSTLAATRKFRDSLTGRKHTLYLSPVLWHECTDVFGIKQLDHRLLQGGLPEPLLSSSRDELFFSEWIDSYYARDIQELFAIRNRTGFIQLLQLVLRQSGGLMDYSKLAKSCELSRPTIMAHIEAMATSHSLFLLPPFHGGGRREITRRPKCYGFDTGFVTFAKGWTSIRDDDRGLLWEHLILDSLRSQVPDSSIFYWRDKSSREIDFIIKQQQNVHTIECKINPDSFDPKSLLVFRNYYPHGKNFVVSPYVKTTYQARHDQHTVRFCSLQDLDIS